MMNLTVAVVDDAFLNDRRMDHSGALMCFTTGSTYETAKIEISLMPIGRFKVYPLSEARQFFINKEARIFGRIFWDKNDKEMKVFTAFIEDHYYADMHSEDVLDSLARFVESLSLKQNPIITETLEELEQFFKSLDDRKLAETFDRQLSLQGKDIDGIRQYLAIATWYGDYWRSYANFLMAYPTMNEEEYKKFIRGVENLPKFGIETLKWGSYKSVYKLVADFLKYHFCNNLECGGFSFKKCGRCNHAHYCNGECQKQGFATHKAECKSRKAWEGYKKEVPWMLKHYVDEGLHDDTDDDVVTMEVFLRELMMKAYSSFHGCLVDGEKSLHATMIYVLIKSKRWHLKVDFTKMDKLMSRDQTAGNFELIRKQMLEFPGTEREDVEVVVVEKKGFWCEDKLYDRVRDWMSMTVCNIPDFKEEADVILSKWGMKRVPYESVEELKASVKGIKILRFPQS